MAFSTQYTLSQDAVFRGKVHIAMRQAAVAVAGETLGTKTFDQWQKRGVLAAAVLRDPPSVWIEQFALAVAQNEAVNGTVDADILFTVNSIWDDMAGVSGRDLQ